MDRSWAPIAVAFIGGIAIALLAQCLAHPDSSALRVVRQSDISSSTAYTFTDPLIGTTGGGDSSEYQAPQNQITAYITKQQQSGLVSASVNFRDIEESDGFTINPDTTYDPASLTKVPLAMAYFDLAEQDPSVLSQQIVYSGENDLDADEQIKSSVQLSPGQSYSVEELIEHMIKYSDNNAEQLLADHLASIGQLAVLQDLFANLGIKINPDNPDYMTARSYSVFLRVLYNATYLDRADSEHLLKLLSQTDFAGGISAGLPQGTLVAQKFGDARVPDSSGQIVGAELQNCGIVYYPSHPYILCIMTKGADIGDLKQTIATISQEVYQYIEKHYPTVEKQ